MCRRVKVTKLQSCGVAPPSENERGWVRLFQCTSANPSPQSSPISGGEAELGAVGTCNQQFVRPAFATGGEFGSPRA
jgi:hypothetical protein